MNILNARSRICGAVLGSLMMAGAATSPAIGQSVSTSPRSSSAERESLSLDMAIQRSLAASPYGAIATARLDAVNAARVVAGAKPQPSVEVTAENFGIPTNDLYDQFQLTGTYNQRIERGGKRQARVALADTEWDVASAELAVARLDLIKAVQLVFVEAQATSAKVAIAQERLRVARELRREVGRRVASAKDPIFAGTRAQTAVSEAEADLALAEHARDAALKRLVSFWNGADRPVLAGVTTFLDVAKTPPATSPSPADLAIFEAKQKRAAARVLLEQSNAARDLTVSAGPRLIGSGNLAAVAGVSMPLGGKRVAAARVAEAQAEGRRLDAELALERYNRDRQIALAAERVEESRHEVEVLRGDALDNAERTLEQVRFGYNRGFFSFADVSAAQTTLVNLRARIVDAAERYHVAQADLDRLTGRFTTFAREQAQ